MLVSAARISREAYGVRRIRRFRLNCSLSGERAGFIFDYMITAKLDCIFTVLCLVLSSAYGQSSTNQFRFEDYLLAPVRIHLLKAKDFPMIQTT